MENQIIFLTPIFTHNIWGGTRLQKEFGYDVSGDDIGECWGIAAHKNGDCTVKTGIYKGKKLSDLWKEHPEIFGNKENNPVFPLLVKIIDAKDDLSIQVHPNDTYAQKNENGSLGKTECWYVLDCPEDAKLVIGHNAKTKDELQEMIFSHRWTELIRELPVKKGDFIQINPGTVHAIKGGLLILETQQNSDITYRVYDYDRLSDGKPRQLHVSQSIDVIEVPAKKIENSITHTDSYEANHLYKLIECNYYSVYKVCVDEKFTFPVNASFLLATVVDGEGYINNSPIIKGDHMILPNGVQELHCEGNFELIFSHT